MRLFLGLLSLAFSINIFAETKFYGEGHIAFQKNNKASKLIDKGSFIGFKGAVALDHGLVITHKVELKTDLTQVLGNSLTVQDGFLGIKGDFGEIRMGKHDFPFEIVDDSLKSVFTHKQSGLISNTDKEAIIAYAKRYGAFASFVSYTASNNNKNSVASLMVNHVTGPYYTGVAFLKESGQKAGGKFVFSIKKPTYHVGFIHKRCPSNVGATVVEINQGECSRLGGDRVNNISGVYRFGQSSISAQLAKNNKTNIKKHSLELSYSLGKSTKFYLGLDKTANKNASSIGLLTRF